MQTTAKLMPGFSDPVHDAQAVFRHVLEAMSHPGRIVTMEGLPDAPAPLHPATAAICLSLADHETRIWVDSDIAEQAQALSHLKFFTGAPIAGSRKDANIALVSDLTSIDDLSLFGLGTEERPDLSTTVIVQVDYIDDHGGVRLTGPGIETEARLALDPIDAKFWQAIQMNAALFPRGVDLIITTKTQLVCLPRTTQVEV